MAEPPSTSLGITDTATADTVAEQKWQQANRDLWSVLLLTTYCSASNTLKTFEGKRSEDGTGHGPVARKARAEKNSGHGRDARNACHEKLVNRKMEPGQDPDNFTFVLDERRYLYEEM